MVTFVRYYVAGKSGWWSCAELVVQGGGCRTLVPPVDMYTSARDAAGCVYTRVCHLQRIYVLWHDRDLRFFTVDTAIHVFFTIDTAIYVFLLLKPRSIRFKR